MADVNEGEGGQTASERGRFGPLALCAAIALLAFVAMPVVWVIVHRFVPIPGTMLMVDRAFAGDRVSYTWRDLSRIDPALVKAAIGAEDSRFCTHDGFDLEAIENALRANAKATNQKRGRMRGGSTISQQTAKNVFAWADRSWARKAVETYYAVLIEALWPKARIMEAYLNIAEWGDGRFGAEAAARGLFSTSADGLSDRQAAALASVLPSPNRWSAVNPGRYVRSRINAIVSRASVVGSDGLADCVLSANRSAPAARPNRPRPPPLPPLPAPPAAEAPAADTGMEEAPGPDSPSLPNDQTPLNEPSPENGSPSITPNEETGAPADLRPTTPAPEEGVPVSPPG